MGYFMIGLCVAILGFGFFQFSRMFNLYTAQEHEDKPPWPYWILRTIAYMLMALGVIEMVQSLF
jgi:hypothetical protein